MSRVLVTGGSGFIAGHVILQVLEAGHEVRATVRSPTREAEVRALAPKAGDRLSCAVADLTRDAGWAEAVAGCEYVLHVASPLPSAPPKDENELIIPARDGTLRVLRAARDAGVRRVVVTSSFAAIGYGHPPRATPFTENDWTNPADPHISAYAKSKTLAERAAWDFIAGEGGSLELAVVNPVGVFGPALRPEDAASLELVKRIVSGGMPAAPRLYFGVVDVRDVADLHLRAMTHPAACGQRFLAIAGDFLTLQQIATLLGVRSRELPDWLVRLIAPFAPPLRPYVHELGKRKNASAEKARRLLGWTPRPPAEALRASAESLRPTA
jgi:nucleoside-diphosphate-sugar epimerase